MKKVVFDFGTNWQKYSNTFLNDAMFRESARWLLKLLSTEDIKGKRVLDLGCGSGIAALNFLKLGAAHVTAIDINKNSISTTCANAEKLLSEIEQNHLDTKEFSILDSSYKNLGMFDVVYSWGVLHHTGAMYKAIDHACALVNSEGKLVISIYQTHWSSTVWSGIKWGYNHVPAIIQRVMAIMFCGIIYIAKFLATGRNPLFKERGMSFYYDVVDWIGGYPYEHATKEEIVSYITKQGFELLKHVPPPAPAGCMELVFQKEFCC